MTKIRVGIEKERSQILDFPEKGHMEIELSDIRERIPGKKIMGWVLI